jgi:hypothetical protein
MECCKVCIVFQCFSTGDVCSDLKRSCFFVLDLSCVGGGLSRDDPLPKESYQMKNTTSLDITQCGSLKVNRP